MSIENVLDLMLNVPGVQGLENDSFTPSPYHLQEITVAFGRILLLPCCMIQVLSLLWKVIGLAGNVGQSYPACH